MKKHDKLPCVIPCLFKLCFLAYLSKGQTVCHTLGIYEVLPGHQMETFEIPHIFMPSLQVLSERATRTSFIDSLMVKPQKSDMKNSTLSLVFLKYILFLFQVRLLTCSSWTNYTLAVKSLQQMMKQEMSENANGEIAVSYPSPLPSSKMMDNNIITHQQL